MPPMMAEKITVRTRASEACCAAASSWAIVRPRRRSRNAMKMTVTRIATKAAMTIASLWPSVMGSWGLPAGGGRQGVDVAGDGLRLRGGADGVAEGSRGRARERDRGVARTWRGEARRVVRREG